MKKYLMGVAFRPVIIFLILGLCLFLKVNSGACSEEWWTYTDPEGRWSIDLPSGWRYKERLVTDDCIVTYLKNESYDIGVGVGDYGRSGPKPESCESLVYRMVPVTISLWTGKRVSNIRQVGSIRPITTNEGNTGYEFTLQGSYEGRDVEMRIALFKNDKDEVFIVPIDYEVDNPNIENNTEILKSLRLRVLPGDVNGDGQVTIDEVQKVINAFLGLYD